MFTLTNEEFEMLAAFAKINFGLDLTAKKFFVEMRIQKLMTEHRFDTFADYFQYVQNDLSGEAVASFISGLTVNYTLFNRESFHFEFVATEILPKLYLQEQATRDLRIWSAGCSTGEEAYTLAIIIADFLGPNKRFWDTSILATDISTFVLKKALVGSYPKASIVDLKPDWKQNYFVESPLDPDTVLIAPSIKQEVIFRKQNLVKDPFIFKQKFHFIFCRNVMIYFDEPTRNSVIRKFYDNLADGGYLFIGMSETINHHGTGFEYVMPSIYKKVPKESIR